METNKNRLRVDFKDMPDLKTALGGLQPGERFTLEFELMVAANNDDFIEADVEAVDYETTDQEGKEEAGSTETSADEPVMVELMRKNASKNSKDMEEDTAVEDEDSDAEETESKK